jgi:ATP-binding cassette subfamily F protein 3
VFTVSDITLHFGERALFDGVGFHLDDGERAAIVGPNGSGKTTLLRIVAGQQSSEGGEVIFPNNTEVGYLPQHLELTTEQTVEDVCREVFSEVLEHEAELRSLEHRMAELADHRAPEFERIADRYEYLQHELRRRDSHTMKSQIGRVLAGLGFKEGDAERPCSAFSGGWQMRIALARILLQNPDILLLDEPTNHLDIESIEWLAEWISGHQGSVLMVSHERAFLDQLCTKTIALEGAGRLTVYRGNYSQSLQARADRREQQRRAYENQQQEIAQIQRFIERFRYQASKASLVQSRVKALDRMERVEPPAPDDTATIRIRFPQPGRTGKEVLRAEKLTKAYGTNVVLREVDFTLYRGEKVALVGLNGAGKTTLMRILARRLDFDSGTVQAGGGVNLEYFAQYEFEDLHPDRTVLQEFYSVAPLDISAQARSILGAFLFRDEDVDKSVRVLSGGERTRLRLAKMLCGKASLLLLDEPTNHLDIGSRLTLENALRQYEGSVLFVSHDRYFLDSVPTRVVEVADGRLRSFPGNYSDYLQMRELVRPDDSPCGNAMEADSDLQSAAMAVGAAAALDSAAGEDTPASSLTARQEAEARRLVALTTELASVPRKLGKEERRRLQQARQEWSKKVSKVERRVREAEKEIATRENRIRELDREMNRPAVASDSGRLVTLVREQEGLRGELVPLYEEWEKAQSWMETLRASEPQPS